MKQSLFKTYTRHSLYFEYVWHIWNVYRWNIIANQMNANNYTLWNIDDNQWHLKPVPVGVENWKFDFAYMFRWVKPRGSTLCEGLGAVLPLPVKWPRLTGAIGACLQRRHIVCCGWHHMTPIPDEISIHKANSSWNLYQIKYYFKHVPDMTYSSKLY